MGPGETEAGAWPPIPRIQTREGVGRHRCHQLEGERECQVFLCTILDCVEEYSLQITTGLCVCGEDEGGAQTTGAAVSLFSLVTRLPQSGRKPFQTLVKTITRRSTG